MYQMLCKRKLCSTHRRITLSKLIIFFLVLVMVFQIKHLFLISKLKGKSENSGNSELSKMIKNIYESYQLDASGSYHMIPNVVICSNCYLPDSSAYKKYDVSIVTQTSLSNLHYIVGLAVSWAGPISVSVFAFDDDTVTALSAIETLRKCNLVVLELVTFHLVYPLQKFPRNLYNAYETPTVSCSELPKLFESTVSNYAFEDIQYPHNVLRNLAIKNSKTEFIFMIDIDMLPSPGLRTSFAKFIKIADTFLPNLTAFIVPSFESEVNVSLPADKKELLKKWDAHQIRPFYYEVCWKCQRYTDYETWREIDGSHMKIAYNTPWKDPWEPFFITRHFVPTYDERFKQYGFNRISNVCELHVVGYTFSVLSNAFLVHQGFKITGKFHSNKVKELNMNRMLFRKFKEELKTKYPYSMKRCY